MSFFYDVLHSADKELIKKEIEKHYEINLYKRFEQVFEQLRKIPFNDVKTSLIFIFIKVYRFDEEENIYLDKFDHDEPGLLFDVCIGDAGGEDEEIYSVLGMDYHVLLGCYVNDDTLKKFSPEQIVAHVIWDMDW